MLVTAADILELGYLTLRTVGHNKHGAYVAIDSGPDRVAYFKFEDEKVHYYEGSPPSAEHQNVIDKKIAPWFKNKKNFNRAARAWNAQGLLPTIKEKV